MEVNWQLFLSTILAILTFYYIFIAKNRYQKHGIPHQSPLISIKNYILICLKKFSWVLNIKDLYNVHEKAKYIIGYDFFKPIVVIRDIELIKSITIKNFEHFINRRQFVDPEVEPLFGSNLSALQGNKWREIRTLLTPTFTSNKMKTMFKLMSQCAETFTNSLLKQSSEKSIVVNSKEIFSYYTSDTIATCAFGITVDSISDPKNDFYMFGKKMTSMDGFSSFKFLISTIFPKLGKFLKFKLIPKDAETFFYDLIRNVVIMRDEQGIVRPDMLQLMMDTRENKSGNTKPELTIENMTSHAFIFFFAGFELISNLLCFLVHEIVANPDVKKKLQQEVDQVYQKCDGDPTYEAIHDMEYLDAIINEVLRLHPISVMTDRLCTKQFELPPSLPGAEPLLLEPGDQILIPIWPIHNDPQYFSEPDKFIPERFVKDFEGKLNMAGHLPFSLGPRKCIGDRFAILETKVLIANLFYKFNIEIADKMITPIKIDTKTLSLTVEGGFWIQVQPRKL